MDPMTLAVAGVAALAILLIAVGIATLRRRLGHLAPASSATPRASRERQGRRRPARARSASCIAQSAALASLNKVVEQRDFGANLARDIARADLKLKPSRVPR